MYNALENISVATFGNKFTKKIRKSESASLFLPKNSKITKLVAL